MSTELETWRTKVECVTVRKGDIQADVAQWANLEGVIVEVTRDGAPVLTGSLRYEEMEALCAAFAMMKA